MKTGIVLSGGGARGAYQAGVIRALCEIAEKMGVENPFRVISGISAGAINASYLASHCDDLKYVGPSIANLWSEIQTEKIVNVSPISVGKIGAKLIRQFAKAGDKADVKGLIDTAPLYKLISEQLRYQKIEENLQNDKLDALAITATNYSNSHAVTFVQTVKEYSDWKRVRRQSQSAKISVDHIMASSAIPMLFPAIKIGDTYYGDGGIRNGAPLSPAIHLGVDQLIVVGVRMKNVGEELDQLGGGSQPSMAHILSVLVHGLLMDAIDLDIERLERFNEMSNVLGGQQVNGRTYNKVEYLWISPSKYLGSVAEKFMHSAPAGIRFLLSGLGTEKERADLFSYLLFEKEYLQELIQLGYEDAFKQRDQVELFLGRSSSS